MLRLMMFSLVLLFTTMNQVMAKEISFVDLDGKTVNLSDYKGKWVVVNYWATWCPPCVVEIPELVAFHEANKDKNAVVIGVNHQDDPVDHVKAFADERFINYPVVRKPGVLSNGTPFGALKGLPTTYMINPEGEVIAARTGLVDQQLLENFIQQNTK